MGHGVISKGLTERERLRFRKLLELAAKSPYAGERQNALQAAERMADRHGLSLDEAARDMASANQRSPARRNGRSADSVARSATWWGHSFAHARRRTERTGAFTDEALEAQKTRHKEAIEEAQRRGLDADEKPPGPRPASVFRIKPGPKREPVAHAHALLAETSIPMEEIADITGLNVYEIFGMKLKMRRSG